MADALIACGVNPEEVDVERDDLCREDVLTFSTTDFSKANLDGLAELYLSFPSRFVFASDDLDETFQAAVSQSPRILELQYRLRTQQADWLKAKGLAGFPPFDPVTESVLAFSRRVEAACGFGQGDLLSVDDDGAVRIDPKDSGRLTLDDTQTLMALMETFGANVPWRMMGQTAEEGR
ncbi:hypothetical protein [Brevundimonas sp. NIBR10]|uniref:hypothetical protein n=1 Tax=Brevundimonas sp. NIBR10 TaxID=3015997 RepID=UPI0022F1CCC4|nr:hypothetical protein [Brevundimonas sp. NIBR10]